jgi:hypothetical protein
MKGKKGHKHLHYDKTEGHPIDYSTVSEHLKKGKPVFAIFYMHGCMPCNIALEQWDKLPHSTNIPDDALTMRINHELKEELADALNASTNDNYDGIRNFSSFPSIVEMNKGQVKPYKKTERSSEKLEEWINENSSKIPSQSKKRTKKLTRSSRSSSRSKKSSKTLSEPSPSPLSEPSPSPLSEPSPSSLSASPPSSSKKTTKKRVKKIKK